MIHRRSLSVAFSIIATIAASRIRSANFLRHSTLLLPSSSTGFAIGATKAFAPNEPRRSTPSSKPVSISLPLSSRGGDFSNADAMMPTSETAHPNLRGLFGGSGVEGMSHPLINQQIWERLPEVKRRRPSGEIKVLYVGTATYDLDIFREKQTQRFVERGCVVDVLDVALRDGDGERSVAKLESADIILVGGGNTLFAFDRWTRLGLVPHFRAAMERGCVLTGGSAGAICWFGSGHSDSADPDTFAGAMSEQYGDGGASAEDESSSHDPGDERDWKYLRVPGLGFVPGGIVCCPHHDRVQSNGLLRARDFDGMLLRLAASVRNEIPAGGRRTVVGIGIDHYSAFIVEGGRYKVYSLPDKPGSVPAPDGDDAEFAVDPDGTARGTPGVWIKRVEVAKDAALELTSTVCPAEGNLSDLLGGEGERELDRDDDDEENKEALERCRRENPSAKATNPA